MKKSIFLVSPFILLILTIPLGTLSLGSFGGANIRIWEIFLIPALIITTIRGYPSYAFYSHMKVLVFVTAFYVIVLISGLNSGDNYDLFIKQSLLLFAMISLFFVAASQNLTTHHKIITRSIMYSGIVASIAAIVDLSINPESIQTYYFEDQSLLRARGYFAEANEYSQFLGVPFSFILATLIFENRINRIEWFILFCGLIFLFFMQLLSLSRGGLVAFFANCVYMGFLALYSNSKTGVLRRSCLLKYYCLLFILALGVLLLSLDIVIVNIISERFKSILDGDDATSMIRLDSLFWGLRLIMDSFLFTMFGIGFGNLPNFMEERSATTANFIADITIETGFIGVIFFLLFLFNVAYLRKRKAQILFQSNELRPIFLGSNMALFGLIVGGLTYSTHMLNFLWLVLGLVTACKIEATKLSFPVLQ